MSFLHSLERLIGLGQANTTQPQASQTVPTVNGQPLPQIAAHALTPTINGHQFIYGTPDINVGPRAPYTPLNKNINFGNPRANPNIPGVPLISGETNAAHPSLSLYGSSANGGQQWYENDNAGTQGGGPYMHIPIVQPGTPQLDTQGPSTPNKTSKFINALPQYVNPIKKYPRISA